MLYFFPDIHFSDLTSLISFHLFHDIHLLLILIPLIQLMSQHILYQYLTIKPIPVLISSFGLIYMRPYIIMSFYNFQTRIMEFLQFVKISPSSNIYFYLQIHLFIFFYPPFSSPPSSISSNNISLPTIYLFQQYILPTIIFFNNISLATIYFFQQYILPTNISLPTIYLFQQYISSKKSPSYIFATISTPP